MKTLTSLEHPKVKYWVELQKSAPFRHEQTRVLIEGKKLISDVAKKQPLISLITTNQECSIQAENSYLVTSSILKKISCVQTSDGVIAEVALPKQEQLKNLSHIIVLDRIQDPGNLGTIIRTALTLGWQGIYLLPGCSDPYNDKAIRSAKGANFFLPLYKGSWEELTSLCEQESLTLLVADLDGTPAKEVTYKKIALILGNEGQGVAIPEGRPHEKVTIPMNGAFDSLNVAIAGGILMYVLHKDGTS